MWELDHKESWMLKNWCFWAVVLEKTLESLLKCKEVKLVNPKGNQSYTFIGRTYVEAEASILWPSDVKSLLIIKDPDAGKDWRKEKKGTTDDKMVGWHHWLNGPEFEHALGVGDGQGSLTCCRPWGRKELHTTEWLNNNNENEILMIRWTVLCAMPGTKYAVNKWGSLMLITVLWPAFPSSYLS